MGSVLAKGMGERTEVPQFDSRCLNKRIKQSNKRTSMAEEFGIEETPDLLGETWRLLPEDEFKMIREIREDSVDSRDRLTVILPKAEGKQRFLRLTPQR